MSPAETRGPLVPIAQITKPHGLRGEVRAHPFGAVLGLLEKDTAVILRKGGDERPAVVENARLSKTVLIIKFCVVDTIEAAQALAGFELCLPDSAFEPLSEGEYYWHQLVGLRVVLPDGTDLGVVEGLFATGANDVLVVKKETRERFIPYTDDAVARVDLDNRTIFLTGQEGLEDL